MASKKLNYFQAIMREDFENDKDKIKNIQKMRNILGCIWTAPEGLSKLDWWADVVTSTPADGVDAAVRAFATNMPSIKVFPPGINDEEIQRAEGIEDALNWSFRKANQRSIHRPIETSLEHILSFGSIGGQVRYIPYYYKDELKKKRGESENEYLKRTRRIRAMRQQGDFTYVFHPPETVHARYSPDLLESVSLAKVMSAADIIREVGDENPGIVKLKADIKSTDEFKKADLEDVLCVYGDFTDYDYRVRLACLGDSIDNLFGKDAYEFTREEHELDFLPWIYRETSKPLLQTVIDSKSYEHQNEMMSMYFAMMKAVVAHPYLITKTASGDGVEVDFTQPGGQLNLGPGEEATALPPRQMDQELPKQVQQGESRLGQQINTRALTALTDFASTTPFATINAILQATIASLSDKRLACEAFWEDAFYQQLRWINYSQIPLQGQRLKARKGSEGNPLLTKGSTVTLGGDQSPGTYNFDPDALTIKVKLREDTPTDRQTRLNSAFMLHKEGKFAMETCLEEFGLDDIEMDEKAWMEEQFMMATVQAKTQEIIQSSDMALREKIKQEVIKEMQAQQQASQKAQQDAQKAQSGQGQGQPMTQENATNQANMGDQNALAQGQQGGSASAQVAPQMTREAVTGKPVGAP